jgi:hypothetical protein
MNKFILPILLLISACTTVPVTPKFPAAPESLLEPAQNLEPLNPNKRELSDLLENVAENYGRYHILELKYQSWQDWYNQQKKIFEEVK